MRHARSEQRAIVPGRRRRAAAAGFTLVEMVIAITLISMLALVAAPLLRLPLAAWLDASRRAALTEAADHAHAKLADDLRRALPNSVRVRQVGTRVLLETLELRAWGRHRAGPSGAAQACPAVCGAAGANDALETSCNETCFTSLGPLDGDAPVAGTDWVVINPRGPGVLAGDPYYGGNVAAPGGIRTRLVGVAPAADGQRLLVAAHNFPSLAANRRLWIVSTPVTWDCDPATGLLTRRWGYPVSALQPLAFGGAQSAPLATQVSACSMRYTAAGSSGRGGIVQLVLRLSVPAADTRVPESVELVASLPVSEGP